jgi:hypothetical protein
MRLPTWKHTLASARNLSLSRNSYIADIFGLVIENLPILAWGLAARAHNRRRLESLRMVAVRSSYFSSHALYEVSLRRRSAEAPRGDI